MMTALNDGGMSVGYVREVEALNRELDGYKPCPTGIWELTRENYMDPLVTRGFADGCAYKVFFDGLPCLPKASYKILFMRRDADEITASLARTEKYLEDSGRARTKHQFMPFNAYGPYNQEDIDHVLGICEARKDFDLVQINYKSLVDNPREIINSLSLPIDIDKAARAINKNFYRQRKE